MGATGGRTDPSVEDLLFARGHDFGFFQAVRLLGWLYPDRPPVGGDARPLNEVVRFHARLSMEFPASEIHSIERNHDPARPVDMTVAFLGLTGPLGVLPWHYTELLIALQAARDPALADFLDLFNHRLISLFCRAWEKHHFAIAYEREARNPGPPGDPLTQYLFDLIGMGTAGLRNRLGIPDQALLCYAGLIAQRPHSASGLRGILRDYFSVPVEIEQFVGKWFHLEQTNLSYLARGGLHNQLGVGAIAGDEVWNQQARFRVQIGPVSLMRYVEFLPDGKAFASLVEWTQFFAGDALEFEVRLVLEAGQVPWCRLSDEGLGAPRLGWLGWLKTEEFRQDARDAVFVGVRENTGNRWAQA